MPLKFIFHGIIVPCSILIPIVIGFLNYKMAKAGPRLLFFFLIISGLINLAAILLSHYATTNLPLLHVYTIVETVFILGYFNTIFTAVKIKKALLFIMVLFPILCVLNFMFLQSIYTFNTHTRPLEAIIITFFCLLYLYRSGFSENWLQNPINWFNIGILIYFPAACIIFILSNYMLTTSMKSMNTMVWNIHAALVFVMYLVWARGFKLIGNGR